MLGKIGQKLNVQTPKLEWFDHDIFSPTHVQKPVWNERTSIRLLFLTSAFAIASLTTTVVLFATRLSWHLNAAISNEDVSDCISTTSAFICFQRSTLGKIGTAWLALQGILSLCILGFTATSIVHLAHNVWGWGLGYVRMVLACSATSVVHRVIGFFFIVASAVSPSGATLDTFRLSCTLQSIGLLVDILCIGLALRSNTRIFDERFGTVDTSAIGEHCTTKTYESSEDASGFDDRRKSEEERLVTISVDIEKAIVIFEAPENTPLTPKSPAVVAPWHKLYKRTATPNPR
ncbi:hypothetical protein HK102_004935 [Quaeritorhiza haematococci]|nr:hypothetical protein HK102_004935 [Quaeritorhiza haematococci]